MTDFLITASIFIAFFVTLFFTPIWISGAHRSRLTGKDMHKISQEMVAESGGIAVFLGFVLGVLVYVAIRTFYFNTYEHTLEIFAILCSIILVALIGFIDDLFGWKIGLTKKTRIFFVFFAAIPLMVINAGQSNILGFEIGIFYPLLLIPVGIIGATTTYNFLAGYNGLEARQGILILSALAIVTYLTGNTWLSVISLILVASLFGFYVYNKHPASVFPGDVLTYIVGALIAGIAIVGNIEKIAVFFFIPYILETILKVRGGLKKESFAKVLPDGSLENQYDKIYGLEHLAIRILKNIKKDKKVYETEVVSLINAFQALIIAFGFIVFRGALF